MYDELFWILERCGCAWKYLPHDVMDMKIASFPNPIYRTWL